MSVLTLRKPPEMFSRWLPNTIGTDTLFFKHFPGASLHFITFVNGHKRLFGIFLRSNRKGTNR